MEKKKRADNLAECHVTMSERLKDGWEAGGKKCNIQLT